MMKINRINDIRRVIYLQRYYCTTDYSKRLADFPNTYNVKDGNRWYNVWEEHKVFRPKAGCEESFRMILPPPNVTGVLHLGHALTCTIQDVLARWYRMRNASVIWVPGLDHAGIATQAVVEKYLYKTKGVGRYDLGKQEFLSYMEQWKNEKGDEIRNQLKALGASLDWSREFFTMSKEHSEAVTEAFIILNQRDLLYRSKALINWSPTLRSAISDIEIEYIQITGKTDLPVPGYRKKVTFGQMAEVAFKLRDSEEEIVVATTRVETMPGDVAIAVNPEDPRYSSYIGREVWHPIRRKFIPIVQDNMVKIEFGTGAVKITPAHDHVDLAVAKRHNLEIIEVIGNDGKMTENANVYQGLDRFEAREKILNQLSEERALRSMRDHETLVPFCSRSGDVVEYLLRDQWFVRTKEMAKRAAEAVQNGKLKIDPPNWANLWCDWLENNRDWCVSRQIWWGHRIPAYRRENDTGDESWIVARSEEDARRQIGTQEQLKQDEDVLDTWFSSALLPLTAMGWPKPEFVNNYPLSLMETGHDIIFLWVARMVMLGLELTNTLPFKEVLFHGVLCDSHGKKMSKSLGNVIKPDHVINGINLQDLNTQTQESRNTGILSDKELKRSLAVNAKMFPDGIPECGADALRLTLCAHDIKKSRINFSITECRANNHFCNKIWQASKYVLMMTDYDTPAIKPTILTPLDRWILSRLSLMVMNVNDAFSERNFYKAVLAIRTFFHYEFCDFFLEATKPGFNSQEADIMNSHRYGLIRCLEVSLRILAPVMPYISDDLYARLAKKLPNSFLALPSLVSASYPTYTGEFVESRDVLLEETFDRIIKIACAIRNLLHHVNKNSEFQVQIVPQTSEDCDHLTENMNFFTSVTRVKNIEIRSPLKYKMTEDSLVYTINGTQCRAVLLLNKTDIDAVKDKIEKQRLKTQKTLETLLKNSSLPKYANKSEDDKLRDGDKIQKLQQTLQEYPKFT